jgi:hypothetical protein
VRLPAASEVVSNAEELVDPDPAASAGPSKVSKFGHFSAISRCEP